MYCKIKKYIKKPSEIGIFLSCVIMTVAVIYIKVAGKI